MSERSFHERFTEKYSRYFHWPARPRGRMKLPVITSNLLDLKDVFDKCKLKFWLVFGTALGMWRDKSFISYDWDTDVAIFRKDREKLFEVTDLLIAKKMLPVRCISSCVSYARDQEYIDVYSFQLDSGVYVCGGYRTKERFFKSFKHIPFTGKGFLVPKDIEGYLQSLYGKNWRTPTRGKHA